MRQRRRREPRPIRRGPAGGRSRRSWRGLQSDRGQVTLQPFRQPPGALAQQAYDRRPGRPGSAFGPETPVGWPNRILVVALAGWPNRILVVALAGWLIATAAIVLRKTATARPAPALAAT
jgi:hypothetical protein